MKTPEKIELLDHKDEAVAARIYSLFQESYKTEAELIRVKDFPPLHRSAKDITQSNSIFWGQQDLRGLIGVIEVEQEDGLLEISSLTIAPQLKRKGIGANLVNFVLSALSWQKAEVQTATANIPAIRLYQKSGFSEQKRWSGKEGIELVLLSKCSDL